LQRIEDKLDRALVIFPKETIQRELQELDVEKRTNGNG